MHKLKTFILVKCYNKHHYHNFLIPATNTQNRQENVNNVDIDCY